MTLKDLFNQIINYNLNELGSYFLYFFVILLTVYFIGIVIMFLVGLATPFIYEKFKKKAPLSRLDETQDDNWEIVSGGEVLFCYFCTRKISSQIWKKGNFFYCAQCQKRLSKKINS
jgi:hypothetical protein